jgi:hypothetical protein
LIGTTSTSSQKNIGISWTNFVAIAMETKKGGFKKNIWIPFIKLHETL